MSWNKKAKQAEKEALYQEWLEANRAKAERPAPPPMPALSPEQERLRQENRRRYPKTAAMVDLFRAHFGPDVYLVSFSEEPQSTDE